MSSDAPIVLDRMPANDVVREFDAQVYVSWDHVQQMRQRECQLLMKDIARIAKDYDGPNDHAARSALEQVRQELGAVMLVEWGQPAPAVTQALIKPTPIWETIWRKVRWFFRHPLRGRES